MVEALSNVESLLLEIDIRVVVHVSLRSAGVGWRYEGVSGGHEVKWREAESAAAYKLIVYEPWLRTVERRSKHSLVVKEGVLILVFVCFRSCVSNKYHADNPYLTLPTNQISQNDVHQRCDKQDSGGALFREKRNSRVHSIPLAAS